MPVAKLIVPTTKQEIPKLRVAAYCRVSSNSADQRNSFATQERVYRKQITENPDWELVDIFADEGLSGMKADTRPEFQRMIRMCELHQIDLILTKSVSRFARNVKEALSYTRKLKLLGVGVQFEEDGVNTLAMADEMLLNTFAAIAQEESKSISQNQRLSIVKRMESGEYIASNAPYGYRLIDKKLVIYEPEAEVVRWIFAAYLNGMSTVEIAHELSAKSVLTKGKKEQWKANRIAYILSNEKYDGDTLFQKYYGEETVPFKKHRNYGEMDQFFAYNTHDAILPQGMFQAAQTLLQSRGRKFGRKMSQLEYPLTSRIRCSECGAFYHRKVRNGTVKWVCSRHAADTTACNSGYYSEERIYDGIITMINKLRFCEEDILGQTIQKLEFAAAAYKRNNRAASQLSQSIAELNAKLLALERLRTKGYLAADIYHTQAREIRQQLGKLKTERYSSFESRITTMLEGVRKLKSLFDELEQPLEVFDEKLFHEIVTDICINHHDEMTVTLLGGLRFTRLSKEPLRSIPSERRRWRAPKRCRSLRQSRLRAVL